MAGQIKAVLFDLDNTLADRVSAFRSLITALWHDEPKIQQFSSVEETVAAFELWDADGLMFPKRKIFERAVSRWGKLSRGPKELESWYYASYASHFEPDDRVNAALDTLDESGIPWAVITNGPPFQADVARAIGIYGRGPASSSHPCSAHRSHRLRSSTKGCGWSALLIHLNASS